MNRIPLRIPEARQSGGLARVLIIADDDNLRTLIGNAVSSVQGAEITSVDSAKEAIRIIQANLPDVIIADVALHGLDGFRFCKLLKHPLCSGSELIPVILVSNAHRDVLAEHVARKARAFAFLKVPGDIDLAPRTVELALRRLLSTGVDKQLLAHKGTVHVMCADDTLAHTILTALDQDEWKTQRFRSTQVMEESWKGGQPEVVFVEVSEKTNLDFTNPWSNGTSESPVVVALLRHAETDSLMKLLDQGVDDYIALPTETPKIVEACREAKLKYNFRSMHREFDSQLFKLRTVTEYLELVITNSHEAIFTCDPVGIVKLWNKGAERVYGFSADEMIGNNVDDYLDPPGFSRKSPSVVRLLMQRGSMTDPEVMRQRKSGEVFPVSATYTLLKDLHGKVLGFSVIERDVTTVKALESERIKSARLRAITQTAVTANDHINTPLGIILGYAQFLELKLNGADAQDKNALEVIQQQVHKIKGIMNKLKLISDPIVKNYSIEGVTMLDLTKSQLSDETTN